MKAGKTFNTLKDAVPYSVAREAFDMLKNDRENAYDCGQWCGVVRRVMTGRVMEAGMPLRAIGTAMIVAPEDCPREDLMGAAEMRAARDVFSFDRALKRLVPGRDFVTHQGYRFQRDEVMGGRPGIVIQHEDGSPVDVPVQGWRAELSDDGGEKGGAYTDHITLAVRTLMPDGSVQKLVLDPSLSDEGPMTFSAWHAAMGCPPAICVYGDHTGIIHPEPTTEESRRRLAKILSCPEGEREIREAVEEHVKCPETYVPMVGKVMAVLGGRHNWEKAPYLRLPYTRSDHPAFANPVWSREGMEADRRLVAPFAAFEKWMVANREAGLAARSAGPSQVPLSPVSPQ